MRPTHIVEGNLLYSMSTDLKGLSHLITTCTVTSRLVFAQTAGYHSLAKVMHKLTSTPPLPHLYVPTWHLGVVNPEQINCEDLSWFLSSFTFLAFPFLAGPVFQAKTASCSTTCCSYPGHVWWELQKEVTSLGGLDSWHHHSLAGGFGRGVESFRAWVQCLWSRGMRYPHCRILWGWVGWCMWHAQLGLSHERITPSSK